MELSVVVKDGHVSEFKEFAARAKNCQNTLNWRLKSVGILDSRFRHEVNTEEMMRLHKHKMAVQSQLVVSFNINLRISTLHSVYTHLHPSEQHIIDKIKRALIDLSRKFQKHIFNFRVFLSEGPLCFLFWLKTADDDFYERERDGELRCPPCCAVVSDDGPHRRLVLDARGSARATILIVRLQ